MLSDHSQMLHTTHVLRRPAVVIWGLAMLATGLAVVLLGAPRVGYTNLINAGMIIVLLIAGNRTAVEPTLTDAAIRWLIVALIAPIYWLTQPAVGVPYSTPAALAGLLIMGAIAYAVKLILGGKNAEHTSLRQRWRDRFHAIRWYVLAIVPLGGLLGVLWTINAGLFVLGLAPLAVAQHLLGNEIALRRSTADL